MKTTIKILLALTMIIAVSCNKDEENNDISKKYSMTILTGMTAGHDIYLYIDALIPDREGIWIDLNNNGKKDNGENNVKFGEGKRYEIGSSTITIYGKVTILDCSGNFVVKSLDVSKNPYLRNLYCYENDINGEAMTSLMMSLPQHKTEDNVKIWVIATNSQYNESNVCTEEQVNIATDKNWTVFDYYNDDGENDVPYAGS